VSRPRQLTPGIALFPARTPTLPPATHTNSYALGTRQVLLVEPATPYEDEQGDWLAWARALPTAGRCPIAIFVTHHHLDHVGGARVLARELALPLWAHAETAVRMDVPVTRRLVDDEAIVLDGPASERWTVLHTPGHAPGHLCLYQKDAGAIVVGDMIASEGTILIEPGDGDMRVYLEQLGRLASLDARVALPAHGEPIDAPTAVFRGFIAHRRMREERVLAALVGHGNAGATSQTLVANAYDDVPISVWPIAVLSIEAHLAKLVDEGRVRTVDGARYIASA
jgi:ribonuclease/clavin/mitogillin